MKYSTKIDKSICRARLGSGLSCRNCMFDDRCDRHPKWKQAKTPEPEQEPDAALEADQDDGQPRKREHRMWTNEELLVALNKQLTVKEVAAILGRAPRSIYAVRQKERTK